MPENSSSIARITICLVKAKPELRIEKNIDPDKHLHFDYGLDSLGYERFFFLLEEEFGISIEEDIRRSGYFSSLNGVKTLLSEEMNIL